MFPVFLSRRLADSSGDAYRGKNAPALPPRPPISYCAIFAPCFKVAIIVMNSGNFSPS